jgi:outer membrane immunogenic protein
MFWSKVMKNLVVLTGAFAATLTSAFAADLPRARRSIPSAVMSPVPVARQATQTTTSFWNGGYIGGHLGYGFKNAYPNSILAPSSGSGIIGGLQAGYDWQFNSFVMGLAGDVSSTSMSASTTNMRGDVDWTGSLRARAGFLATNRLLVYGTGGFAFGGVKMTNATASQRQTLMGYTVGMGAEYAFTQNIAAFLEYRYTSLNGKDYTSIAATNANYGAHFNSIRAGLNYRF